MYETFHAELMNLDKNSVVKLALSRKKNGGKVTVRPIMLRSEKKWQIEKVVDNRAYHSNIDFDSLCEQIRAMLDDTQYEHINIYMQDRTISYKLSKKGKLFRSEQRTTDKRTLDLSHDREKNYILKEGENIPALVDLGIFDADFRLKKSKADKFRQINRFVEIIAHEFTDYGRDSLNIIDFGCGKSYLTFILYYYFTEVKGVKVNMIGYDLKREVIADCNAIAEKYGYENLSFRVGDVSEIEHSQQIDAVISLHACDTATDYALHYAIKNKIKYIFSVPCCQHEINAQINCNDELSLLLEHGIYKERFSALLTDVIRCEVLKNNGYEVDAVEFVEIENTPKNSMIRARLKGERKKKIHNEKLEEKLEELTKRFNINPKILELQNKRIKTKD